MSESRKEQIRRAVEADGEYRCAVPPRGNARRHLDAQIVRSEARKLGLIARLERDEIVVRRGTS